jgi:hypothetical protein
MKTIVKYLVPNVGTLIVVGMFFLAQSVGALPNAAPAEPLAAAQPLISYQGTLTDPGGAPINEMVKMEFALYDDPSIGNQKWGVETQWVEVSNGLFHVLLGNVTPIDPAALAGDLYLDIQVNDEPLVPRERLTSIVDAITAQGTHGDFRANGYRIVDVSSLTNQGNIIHTAAGSDPGIRLISQTDITLFIDSDNNQGGKSFKIYHDNGAVIAPAAVLFEVNEAGRVELRGTLDMNGSSVVNCGALTEANLQTEEELAAEHIARFEEGDILCWGDSQLEKCTSANDRLVQAVADADGRPIVIGAELVKVVGPVKRGDILVASNVPGYAMANNDPTSGSVIAQALEDFEGEQGVIKAMIRKW